MKTIKTLFLAGLFLVAPVQWAWAQTAINAAGSYGAGEYYLSGNISGALTFTGTAKVDLKGYTVTGTSSGNTVDTGVTLQGTDSTLYTSVPGGKVTNFWAGAKCEETGCTIQDVDLSANRYFGAQLNANGGRVLGGKIEAIGGVTNEAYAIGVQVGACDGCAIIGVRFKNFYKQSGYSGSSDGVGLPVNFSAASANGIMLGCLAENDTAEDITIGVFVGSGGGHLIEGNTFRNFHRGIAVADIATSNANRNTLYISSALSGSKGIGGNGAVSANNVIAGYETAEHGSGTHTGNIIVGGGGGGGGGGGQTWGSILDEAITTNFGNLGGKTQKVHVAAAALTAPSGTPTQIKVTVKATADEPLQIGAIYVGHKATSGDAWDAASLTQLKLNGSGSFTIPQGQSVTLDAADFAWDKTSDLIFSFYDAGSTGVDGKVPGKTFANALTWTKYGNTASTADDTGMGSSYGYLTLVAKIETDGF